MKIKPNKESGIVSVDDANFAVLTSIRDTDFLYDFTYFVDTEKAMRRGCNVVRIDILTKPVSVSKEAVTVANIVDKLLIGSSEKKAAQRSKAQNVVTGLTSDFTANISNTKTSISTRETTDDFIKVLQLRSVEEISGRDLLLPITQRHSFVKPEQYRYDSARSKELAMSLICDYNIDPAQVGDVTNFIVSSQKAKGGTISPKKAGKSLPGQTNFLVDSIIQNTVQPTSQLQVTPGELVATLSSVENIFTKTVEELEIPNTTTSTFFVKFTLLDAHQNEVDSLVRQVDHANLVALYKQPRLAPYIFASATRPGKNVIEIKQNDIRGKKIQIFRKIINNNTQSTSLYTLLSQVDITSSQGPQRFEDIVPNGNPIIYRAISVGDQEILGAEFNSAVTSVMHSHSFVRSPKKNFLTLTHSLEDAGVALEIRDIPAEITGFKIFRVNLTNNERAPTLVGSPIQTIDQHMPTVTLLDNNVKPGNVYSYTCKFINRFGKEEDANTSVTVEFSRPLQGEKIITKISSPTVTPTGAAIDVSFKIRTSLNKTVVGSVQTALQQQGTVAYYTSDFTAARTQIQNLIAYSVCRTNLATGEVSDFGILTGQTFSDSEIGALRAIPAPLPGAEYKYTVTTFLRKADTMLDIDRNVPLFEGRSSYTFKPSRWLHPLVLSQGTLATSESLVALHGKNEFLYGSVGAITNVTVAIPDSIPSISELITQKINDKTISLQWKIIGKSEKIDHFIIVLSILGMRTIAGKCHNVSTNGRFRYIHELKGKEQGILKYSMIPVYVDYTRGTETQSQNNIVVE